MVGSERGGLTRVSQACYSVGGRDSSSRDYALSIAQATSFKTGFYGIAYSYGLRR